MRKKSFCSLLIFTAVLFMVYSAVLSECLAADSFRCRGKIVSLNDTQVAVMRKCGKPSYESPLGDYWVYDFGPNKYTQIVKFVKGKVNRIKTGGKGGNRLEE